MPHLLAAGRLQTHQVAVRTQRRRPRGRRPWACSAGRRSHAVAQTSPIRVLHSSLPSARFKRDDELAPVAVAHGEDPAIGDRHAGESATQARSFPGQRRAAFGPLVEQAGVGRDAVAMRTAPAGPEGGGRLAGGPLFGRAVRSGKSRPRQVQQHKEPSGGSSIGSSWRVDFGGRLPGEALRSCAGRKWRMSESLNRHAGLPQANGQRGGGLKA